MYIMRFYRLIACTMMHAIATMNGPSLEGHANGQMMLSPGSASRLNVDMHACVRMQTRAHKDMFLSRMVPRSTVAMCHRFWPLCPTDMAMSHCHVQRKGRVAAIGREQSRNMLLCSRPITPGQDSHRAHTWTPCASRREENVQKTRQAQIFYSC